VSEAKESSSLVVAYVHWGNEYELTHSSAQREFAQSLATAGVDLLIGHHSHVVQDIAVVEGMPVLYSLGNFIFDQYFSAEVQTGLVVTLSVQEDTFTVGLIPHRQCERSVPCLLPDDEERDFLEALAARSDFEMGQIMAKKLTFSR
jgi:poly-gamma-glutamate synthesis protein (capsule biosynthesis protein)